jgi:predicted dehydrogenase
VKAGVIGLGFMGAAHVAAITADSNAELVAVATNNPKARAGDLSETGGNLNLGDRKFDFSRVAKYSDWRDLIADANVEAVTVCLPSNLHAEVSNAALSAGKHVLCEKPMALTVSECESMMSSARNAARTLMIAQVLRFWPEYRKLHEFVTGDEYGKVRHAKFIRKCGAPAWSKWLTDDSVSGGAIMDLLVHDIDQILLLFGMPDRVTGKRIGEADTLMASFIYPGGPEVRLHGGWFEPDVPFAMSFQVRADKGELELTGDGLMLSDMTGVRKKVEVPEANAYAEEVQYFLECCRTGAEPLLCKPLDSFNAVKVALALKESRSKDGEQIQCLV